MTRRDGPTDPRADGVDGDDPRSSTDSEGPDRRTILRYAATAAIGGLAGCGSNGTRDTPTETGAVSQTATDTPGETASRTTTTGTPSATETDRPTTSTEPDDPSETATDPRVLWVAPDGDDDRAGTEEAPLRTFDEAVNRRAAPGDTVRAKPGVYRQFLTMRRGGAPGAPITITGPPDAVLRPEPGAGQVLRIHHSHVHLTGLSIDGLLDPERRFETLEAWVGIGVDITPYAPFKVTTPEYLTDIVIEPHRIGGAKGTLVAPTRIRDASIGGFEVTAPAGMRYDPRMPTTETGHNREIVYMGTSPGNLDRSMYPWDGLDRTRNVRIHHVANSAGHAHSELVDVKVGCENLTVEYCTDRGGGAQTDGNPAGAVSVKGNRCTVRWNDLGSVPYALEFDPYYPQGDVGPWARDNAIYGNYLHDFSEAAIRFPDYGKAAPGDQRVFCGNRIENGPGSYPYATGECDETVPGGDGVGHDHGS